ncbi:MAG: zinc-dependent metalloprotease [Pyrinomonadaceae bacterium]
MNGICVKLVRSLLLLSLLSIPAFAQETPKAKSYAETIAGLARIDGFQPLYHDEKNGEMYLEVSSLDREFLYQITLPTGVGSNFVGLDRGQLGATKVVRFERAGNKLLLVEPNYGYRALSENPAERKAVEDSFAKSVVWGFKIKASEDGKYLVDATSFFIRDAHGVADRLAGTKQGIYKIDPTRSAFYMPSTKGFPKNSEIETIITVTTGGETGREVGRTVPSPDAVTTHQRHSFVELPDASYRPREFDPRVSSFPISFYDYATDIGENLEKRWIVRHRLEKKDPAAAISEAVEPIVYYVDNGTPPDIRDALIEGASWWNQAFEAAGFKDAFQVRVLPADADPMDIRYNVINWVHRSTRGWAYGSSVTDPRTGEIIRGVVTLDSQRARQDVLIAGGLMPQFAGNLSCGMGAAPDYGYLAQDKTKARQLAIARIKQLSAHEVGHTLGFAHNFAASTYGRASVMDYPAPLISVRNGELDYSNAYAVGIGNFDKFAVDFAYRVFPASIGEKTELKKLVENGVKNGMLFLSDADTRPAGAAHPLANLWDNGSDPVARLDDELEIRRIALAKFGLKNIPDGTPMSELELSLLPVYLHHRYQMTAAAKSVGGAYYTYSVRNGLAASPSTVMDIVPADKQRAAIKAVLKTIEPSRLVIPESILEKLPPNAFSMGSQRSERFPGKADPVFDAVGAAEIASNLAIRALLNADRAQRLEMFHARDSKNPGLGEVIDSIFDATWLSADPAKPYEAAVKHASEAVVAEVLMDLAADPNASWGVRAVASSKLRLLASAIKERVSDKDPRGEMANEIQRFLERPAEPRIRTRQLPDPPSDPIGMSLR